MGTAAPGAIIDVISPSYIRTTAISISLKNPESTPRAFQAVDLQLALTGMALDVGVVFPLDLSITPPSATSGAPVLHHTFRRVLPPGFAFTPREGGVHLVRVRERTHNLFWGYLVVDVQGDRAAP